jgi:hypothetical protein
MKSLVKGFTQFINEDLDTLGSNRIELDLVREIPEYYSRGARIDNGGFADEDEDYTHDIVTTLTAIKYYTADDIDQLRELGLAQGAWETDPDWIAALDSDLALDPTDKFIDDSFHTEPVKIKLIFDDDEAGYGGYGPSGGGMSRTIFCGVQEFTKETVLDRFKQLLSDTDLFQY